MKDPEDDKGNIWSVTPTSINVLLTNGMEKDFSSADEKYTMENLLLLK